MIVLLNKQHTMNEILELTRIRIASVLLVPVDAVQARWELNARKDIVPNFQVVFPDTPDITESQVRRVIQTAYQQFKDELGERLAHIRDRRPEKNARLNAQK